MKAERAVAAKGRPRKFDPEQALDRALEVFWRKGYDGASLSDLTEAMGINRPSLYAAFGDKEELFRKVLDRYIAGPAAYFLEALTLPTARDVAATILHECAKVLGDPRNPHGCLVVQGALACGEASQSIQQELVRRRIDGETALRNRFKRAKVEGDLPADTDPAALAQFVMAVSHGMAVQAAGGAGRSELRKIADLAMQAWPR